MAVLAIETGLGAATVALGVQGNVVATRTASTAHGNASELLPLVAEMLESHDVGYAQLRQLVCSVGPGSFTGIRIGLAAARGLALATRLPVVGISTLEATAFVVAQRAEHANSALWVALDAMRGQLYAQPFQCTDGAPTPLSAPQLLDADALRAEWHMPNAPRVVVGNASAIISEWLGADATDATSVDALADAADMLRYSQQCGCTPHSHPPIPVYVRAPDAKLPSKPAAWFA